MAKEPEFSQVTEPQVEIWLANSVTKTFMKCLAWKCLDVRDAAGSGTLVDSSSADLTHALLHRALGQQDAYTEAQKPEELMDHFEMIFHPPPKEEEKEDE